MKHARPDYDRIQDPAGRIPADEPVLLFRAQDKHAAAVARFHADLVERGFAETPRSLRRSAATFR
jgi:hypothetical protein